jgi:hypothetical protein
MVNRAPLGGAARESRRRYFCLRTSVAKIGISAGKKIYSPMTGCT